MFPVFADEAVKVAGDEDFQGGALLHVVRIFSTDSDVVQGVLPKVRQQIRVIYASEARTELVERRHL